jgi:sulfite reductase (ferredoxin)
VVHRGFFGTFLVLFFGGGALPQHRIMPTFDEDKNYYYDWGATDIFSLAGRGVGECSAGLFDLIEVDLKNIRTLRAAPDAVSAGDKRDEILDELALSAARMLLITRGVEAHSEAEGKSILSGDGAEHAQVDPGLA